MQSATYTIGHEQRDGTHRVLFTIVLDTGLTVRVERGPFVDVSQQTLDALAAKIGPETERALSRSEYRQIRRSVAPMTLRYQTAEAFATHLRSEFRERSGLRACEVAWWLIEMIAAGHLTDAQGRNAFGMTPGEWNTFKTNRLVPKHDRWAAALAAESE